MLPLNPDSILDLPLLSDETLPVAPREADEEVLLLFDCHAVSLVRYAASFGLRVHESDDVVQESWDAVIHEQVDPSANPETQLARRQRCLRLAPVIHALPARDRRCLLLRAEGLRYREIARTFEMSLGAVAKSLLPSLVCRGAVDLSTAQCDIAVDWIAACKKYFHTDRPVIVQARVTQTE